MKIIGLMSGTSMDGITAALTAISESNNGISVDLLDYETRPYPEKVKRELLELTEGGDVETLCKVNFAVGEQFALAAESVIGNGKEVKLIGSHGQTVCHLSGKRCGNSTYTLQIGEPDVIAERTGIRTIADFRPRDIAAGGEGAPLIPYVDYKLFQSESRNRVALNLGGIANVTYLPAGGEKEDVLAFDTGPGNMVIDQLVRKTTDGEKEFDEGGNIAAKGNVDEEFLAWLMDNSYVKKTPPKSTGRKDFGRSYAEEVEEKGRKLGLSSGDILASVTAFTAESVKYGCEKYLGGIDEMIAAGGGTKNDFLMQELRRRSGLKVVTTKDFGIPPEAKEAVGFAILAYETSRGKSSNIPGATGAKRFVPLGKISPGEVDFNE